MEEASVWLRVNCCTIANAFCLFQLNAQRREMAYTLIDSAAMMALYA